MEKIKPIIIGIKKSYLTKNEYSLLKMYQPIGYIIFSRNIKSLTQLKFLITQLKSISTNINTIIMIDHEGGRVNRFNKILDQKKLTAKFFGKLFKNNRNKFYEQINNFINCNSNLFNYLGINLIAAPVLDIYYKKRSNVVGDRAFSNNYKDIKKIGYILSKKYQKNKIKTIGKHVPGHGLSKVDSHFKLPVISHSLRYLMKNDFKCFKNINSNFLMTAHIMYSSIDNKNPATQSSIIIDKIIKKHIGFKGLIMSDDLSMKALKGNILTRAKKSMLAGCDIILHCNANHNEMRVLLECLPTISNLLFKKINKIFN